MNQREATFDVIDSHDDVRVVIDDHEFDLVKFEHKDTFIMSKYEADKLAMFILGVHQTGNGTYSK